MSKTVGLSPFFSRVRANSAPVKPVPPVIRTVIKPSLFLAFGLGNKRDASPIVSFEAVCNFPSARS